MKKQFAVVGLGSSGIQALSHFLAFLPAGWEVTSIYSEDIPITGIGESTNPTFVSALQFGTDFSLTDDLAAVDGTLKFGTKYTDWRKHQFVNPLIGSDSVAIHMNTFKLKEYAMPRFREIWKTKFKEIIGTVSNVYDDGDRVRLTIDNEAYDFDYVMDCRGFPKDFTEYNALDDLPINHCIVHNSEKVIVEPHGPNHTGHIATKNGWMFEVPLTSRTSYGYLYNDTITTKDEAREDLARILDVDVDSLDNTEFNVKPYYAKQLLDGRVIKNGNLAAFFEPMFANSLFIYDVINRITFDFIIGAASRREVNLEFERICKDVHDVIAYHYHGGSTYTSEFWDYAVKLTEPIVKNSDGFKRVLTPMRLMHEGMYIDNQFYWAFSPRSLRTLDKNFNYGYFRDKEEND